MKLSQAVANFFGTTLLGFGLLALVAMILLVNVNAQIGKIDSIVDRTVPQFDNPDIQDTKADIASQLLQNYLPVRNFLDLRILWFILSISLILLGIWLVYYATGYNRFLTTKLVSLRIGLNLLFLFIILLIFTYLDPRSLASFVTSKGLDPQFAAFGSMILFGILQPAVRATMIPIGIASGALLLLAIGLYAHEIRRKKKALAGREPKPFKPKEHKIEESHKGPSEELHS